MYINSSFVLTSSIVGSTSCMGSISSTLSVVAFPVILFSVSISLDLGHLATLLTKTLNPSFKLGHMHHYLHMFVVVLGFRPYLPSLGIVSLQSSSKFMNVFNLLAIYTKVSKPKIMAIIKNHMYFQCIEYMQPLDLMHPIHATIMQCMQKFLNPKPSDGFKCVQHKT